MAGRRRATALRATDRMSGARLGAGASTSGAIGALVAIEALDAVVVLGDWRHWNGALEGGADLLRAGVHGIFSWSCSGGGVLRAEDPNEARCASELEPDLVEDERECERDTLGSGRTARGCSPVDGDEECSAAGALADPSEPCTRFRVPPGACATERRARRIPLAD